jgi:cell division protein FtsI (penicillin-binding protein 3)
MSIGQEISVTALQMLTAFSAIANEGRLMQPHIVRAVVDGEGREVRRTEPVAVRQVVSRQTALTLREILTAVVAEGTGARAAVPGYAVAGKTGTAQKPDPATRLYSRRPGVLSFVGFVPADDPRLAMLVMLDEPKTVAWGSEAAAPIFASVASQVLRRLEIPPSDVPSVQILRTAGAPTLPAAPAPASPAGAGLLEAPDGDVVMPDVTGRSLRQALVLLAGHDLDLSIAGRGVVVRQSPLPGSPLTAGAFCRLELEPPVHPAVDGPDGRRAAGPPRPGEPRTAAPPRTDARLPRPPQGQ